MRGAALALLVAVAALTLASCREEGGVGGTVGGAVGTAGAPPVEASGTTTPPPAGATTTTAGAAAAGTSAPPVGPTAPSPTGPAGGPGLRLGGEDLGVTRLGAPFRAAVAAVTAVLGPPSGDPAPDTACIGAEDETAWGPFRLASSGGRVSGWRSASTTLTTPDGVAVGTSLAALRQAYGSRLRLRPAPEPDSAPGFGVDGSPLAGTLSGTGPPDTVTVLFSGTCESA